MSMNLKKLAIISVAFILLIFTTNVKQMHTAAQVDTTPPVVTGVTNGGFYNYDKTITFNEGNATLNGASFISGSTVSQEGAYTLVVTDMASNTTVVSFTIDKTAPTGTLQINGGSPITTTPNVTLDITSNEGGEWHFSNDGVTWTSWEPYFPPSSKAWSLPSGDGTKTVLMELRDMAGNITQKSATITLNTNKPPVLLKPFDPIQSTVDKDITLDLTNYITDPDNDPLRFNVSSTNPSIVDIFLNGNYLLLSPKTRGNVYVTITAIDTVHNTTTTALSIEIINSPPIFPGANITMQQGTTWTGKLNAQDVDGDVLTYSLVTAPVGGTVVWNGDGNMTYTPKPGFEGKDSFNVKVSDGKGGSTTSPVNITVSPLPKYDVTFQLDNYAAINPQKVTINTVATEPAKPTRSGYTFSGWYTDKAFSQKFDFSSPIGQNTTLYGNWIKNNYTVSFDGSGDSVISTQTVPYNEKVTDPGTPVKKGYSFKGWYTDKVFKQSWNFTTDIVTENTVLYAKWVKNNNSGSIVPPTPSPSDEDNVEPKPDVNSCEKESVTSKAIGCLAINAIVPVYKQENNRLVKVSTLQAGDHAPIYEEISPMLGLGGNIWVERTDAILYETPSKKMLAKQGTNTIWKGLVLKPGQIGLITALQDTVVWETINKTTKLPRILKKGEQYRVYRFVPGMFSLGNGQYIVQDAHVDLVK